MTKNTIVLFCNSRVHSLATLSAKLDRRITFFDVNKKKNRKLLNLTNHFNCLIIHFRQLPRHLASQLKAFSVSFENTVLASFRWLLTASYGFS